jgi:hypothetical protein
MFRFQPNRGTNYESRAPNGAGLPEWSRHGTSADDVMGLGDEARRYRCWPGAKSSVRRLSDAAFVGLTPPRARQWRRQVVEANEKASCGDLDFAIPAAG